jgi:hypothetical protein
MCRCADFFNWLNIDQLIVNNNTFLRMFVFMDETGFTATSNYLHINHLHIRTSEIRTSINTPTLNKWSPR